MVGVSWKGGEGLRVYLCGFRTRNSLVYLLPLTHYVLEIHDDMDGVCIEIGKQWLEKEIDVDREKEREREREREKILKRSSSFHYLHTFVTLQLSY